LPPTQKAKCKSVDRHHSDRSRPRIRETREFKPLICATLQMPSLQLTSLPHFLLGE